MNIHGVPQLTPVSSCIQRHRCHMLPMRTEVTAVGSYRGLWGTSILTGPYPSLGSPGMQVGLAFSQGKIPLLDRESRSRCFLWGVWDSRRAKLMAKGAPDCQNSPRMVGTC